MKVSIDGKTYTIEFSYGLLCRHADHTEPRDLTECIIRDCTEPRVLNELAPIVARGPAVRYYRDPPNFELGRKAALKAALMHLDRTVPTLSESDFLRSKDYVKALQRTKAANKARRALFWSAYRGRKAKRVAA